MESIHTGVMMTTRITLFHWEIEFEREKTISVYSSITPGCNCAYCRNFVAATRTLPPAYFALLDRLGIDPGKPAEIIEHGKNRDGLHRYNWWYHVVGRVLWENETNASFANGQVEVLVSSKTDLVDKAFPLPVFQIGFYANLPWVLQEKP